MSNPPQQTALEPILKEFWASYRWLLSLVTDPSGSRYFTHKSQEQRLQEFEEQLARTADFLHFIGEPQTRFNAVHVAGTSGKGSVVIMFSALLAAAGLRTGWHISPYLQLPNEKLVVDHHMISPSGFTALVEQFRQDYSRWQQAGGPFDSIKYSEAWGILTFMWLAQRQVDWGVIETGLGGRFDPTNVLPSKLAVLTNIDYDHVEVLGETLEQIAWHKAGIIKPGAEGGGLAITVERKPEALAVFRQEAQAKGVRLYELGQDFSYELIEMHNGGAAINVDGPYNRYSQVKIPLSGVFQPLNAALAVAGIDVLRHHYQLPVSEESVQRGMRQARFPGRLEVVQPEPLVILDGAHNQHKMHSLVDSLQAIYPDMPFTVVMGMLTIKDAAGMVAALAPIARRWIATQPKVYGKPAMPAAELAETIRQVAPGAEVLQVEGVDDAVQAGLDAANGAALLVTGSLYLLGEARNRWYPPEQLLRELEEA